MKYKDIDELNENELSTTLTSIVRGERFCEGLILDRINDGTIVKILKRFNRLY